MGLYTRGPNTPHEPLGGRQAPDFDRWLSQLWEEVNAERDAVRGMHFNDPRVIAAVDAQNAISATVHEWESLKLGRSYYVIPEFVRDHFETQLIASVMSNYGALRYARQINSGCIPGARTPEAVECDYVLSVRILAAYTGRTVEEVTACGEDQEKLTALGR